jgi:hypothetical protein
MRSNIPEDSILHSHCREKLKSYNFFFTSMKIIFRQLGFIMGRPLRREDGSVIYSCCWASPTQSFSGLSHDSCLMAIFECLNFKIPSTWRTRFLYLFRPGTAWLIYTTGRKVPFLSPLTTRKAKVGVF